jgi:hypothetical protein
MNGLKSVGDIFVPAFCDEICTLIKLEMKDNLMSSKIFFFIST